MLIVPDNTKAQQYAEMFNCQLGNWPIKYLGVAVSVDKIKVSDWAIVEEKMEKSWQVGKEVSCPLGGELLC